MALNISGASIGYDENNVTAALNRIENDVIANMKSELRNRLSQLRDEVNQCWIGKSAETFKENMDHDVELICQGLDAAYTGLENEFNKIKAGLAEVDQELVQKRG